MSYSKKPPERAGTLPEIFELALELVQFHGSVFGKGVKGGDHSRSSAGSWPALSARSAAALGDGLLRQDVVYEELEAALALVLVYVEPVHEPRTA